VASLSNSKWLGVIIHFNSAWPDGLIKDALAWLTNSNRPGQIIQFKADWRQYPTRNGQSESYLGSLEYPSKPFEEYVPKHFSCLVRSSREVT
jgi:hypothetical protein